MPNYKIEIIGDTILYQGDCREVLPTLNAVDHVITDPPYGAQTHAGARTGTGRDDGVALVTFDSITAHELSEIAVLCVEKARRWVIMTCEWRHAVELEKIGCLVRLGVWIKPNGAPQFTGDRPATGWEAIAILHRPGKKRWNGGGHHAVWIEPKINGEHPTQKPISLIARWVQSFSDHGETILDPFMGSGTTGVVCSNLGRKFVGIEIEPRYFDMACQRIDQAQRQGQIEFEQFEAKQTEIDI